MSATGESSDLGGGAERIVVLGRIGGAFGVHGWVRITSYTDPAENILEYDRWLIGGPGRWRPIEIEDGRVTGKGVLVKLDRDRDARGRAASGRGRDRREAHRHAAARAR